MTATMIRPAVTMHRWLGHRHDVCAVIENDGRIGFVARDVLTAIGIDLTPELDRDPSHEFGTLAAHGDAITFDRDQIARLLAGTSSPLHTDFLRWIDTVVATLDHQPLRRTIIPAQREALTAAPISDFYSIADAAKILSRDTGIGAIGRDALFTWLSDHSWIRRETNTWTAQRDMLFAGYLVVVPTEVAAKTELYPQVCITTVGLEVLHNRLGGTSALNLAHTSTAEAS